MKCYHCAREFKKEVTLTKHRCEKMIRAEQEHTKDGQLGLYIWKKFNLRHYGHQKADWKKFSSCPTYKLFMKLGSLLEERRCFDIDSFIDYILNSKVQARKWCEEQLYQEWVRWRIMNESPDQAFRRFLQLIYEQQADQTCKDYFNDLSAPRAQLLIQTGKLSPWIFFLIPESSSVLYKMDETLLNSIKDYLNPTYWEIRARHFTKEIKEIQQLTRG